MHLFAYALLLHVLLIHQIKAFKDYVDFENFSGIEMESEQVKKAFKDGKTSGINANLHYNAFFASKCVNRYEITNSRHLVLEQ